MRVVPEGKIGVTGDKQVRVEAHFLLDFGMIGRHQFNVFVKLPLRNVSKLSPTVILHLWLPLSVLQVVRNQVTNRVLFLEIKAYVDSGCIEQKRLPYKGIERSEPTAGPLAQQS